MGRLSRFPRERSLSASSTTFRDEELADTVETAIDVLRALSSRWRFRIQAGRLGPHPPDETSRLVEMVEHAIRVLGEAPETPAGPESTEPDDGQRFRQLVDNIRDYAIFMLDVDGIVSSWNAGAERIMGYRAEEIIGKHFSIFYPVEERNSDKWRRELEIAGGEGRYEEKGRRTRKTGEIFAAHVTLTSLRDPAGRLTGFAKVTQDVTDLRSATEELRQSEERLRLMIEAVRDYAIFRLTPGGHVASWNVGAKRLKGYDAEEIIGQHFSKFYPEEEQRRGHPEYELRRAVADGRYEEEGWRIRKDGSRFWANVVITALFDAEGRHVGFTKVTRDFTETRRLREAQLAIEVRDEFLSVAGHELRTPLTALLMQVQGLARTAEPGTRLKERLERAVASGQRLDTLLGQVLDVSRITAGRLELEPEQVRLEQLVGDVVERFADAAAAAHSPIQLRLVAVTGCWDRIRLEQVVTNLLSNAIKYGNGKPIEIETAVEAPWAVVRVIDHGIGIAAEDRERIFERFERVQHGRGFGGLGLGLWISLSIVKASGGTIEVTGEPGEGSIFTARLPLASRESNEQRS